MSSKSSAIMQDTIDMNSKFITNLFFRMMVAMVAITVAFIVAVNTYHVQGDEYLFLLPLLYGILFFLMPSLWKYRQGNIGMTVLNIVIFTRYVVAPLFRALSIDGPNIRGIVPSNTGIQYGIIIIIVELLITFIVVQLLAQRIYEKKFQTQKPFHPLKSRILLFLMLFLGLGLIGVFPQLLDRYNFFIVTDSIERMNIDLPLSGLLILITDLILVIFPIIMLDFFKKRYDKNPNFKYVLFSIAAILPSITIFKGTSRFSVLIPTVAFMVILIKLYPRYKKQLILLISSLLIIVFISVTLYTQFGYTQGDSLDSTMDTNEIAYNFDAYMSGPDNMGRVIDLKNTFESNLTIETFKNDLFNNVALLSNFSDSKNTTTAWFNLFLYGHDRSSDQIVPLSGQSYLHFGPLGMPLFLIITIILMMYFDSKVRFENRIEYVYIYVYLVMYMSMAMMVSFGSIYPIFTNLLIPVLILFKLNRTISVKKSHS